MAGIKSVFKALFQILVTAILIGTICLLLYGYWKCTYYDTNVNYYTYNDKKYLVHIVRGVLKYVVVDVQYDNVLISKVFSLEDMEDFYIKREDNPYLAKKRDYDKIIQYMLDYKESEGEHEKYL